MPRIGGRMRRSIAFVAFVLFACSRGAEDRPQRLAWIETAHQLGPVGYRDPVGAISPDGTWLAYSEGRFLRVRPIGGGPGTDFPPADSPIGHLIWHPDGRTILADGFRPTRWATYDRVDGSRRPLWEGLGTLTAAVDDTSPATSSRAI